MAGPPRLFAGIAAITNSKLTSERSMNLRTLLTLTGLAAGLSLAFANEGHNPAAAAKSDSYPLTTCVVSGDKLGEMGDPVKYTYRQPGQPDRVVEFCCKDCIADFEKDPAKYLAQLDAAAAGHTPTGMKAAAPAEAQSSSMAGCCATGTESCCAVVKAYLPIASALAADDLAQAQNAAATLARQAKADGMTAVYRPALAVIHAGDLAAAREAFKSLSNEVTPLVENNKDYVVMHCPMAKADWVQTDATVRNPYYGKAMLSCGMPKK